MADTSESLGKAELGVAGRNTRTGQLRADEFLPELRGKNAIRAFREMRENDSTVGAVMYATEQTLRDIKFKVKPADDSEGAAKEAQFVEEVLSDMEHTLDDHISEALSSLSYGFSIFEVVYKRRMGNYRSPKKRSKYNDGRIGIRKLASRAQWTISRFDVDQKSGDIKGVYQDVSNGTGTAYIPASKLVHYRTTTTNNDPAGRSILRNAYTSYKYLNSLQKIEAIAIERELHGVPVLRIPSEYLAPDATEEHIALRNSVEEIARDLKLNEQAYMILPSDCYTDADGNPTDTRLMDVSLITSEGNRNIEIGPVVQRYKQDIARSLLAEFIMLGATENGSYALSKSKTDLFLRTLESYINAIADCLNKQLIEPLWDINGLDKAYMPKIVAGDVAQHDLENISRFLRNLNGAGISVSDHDETVSHLMDIAELDYDK